MKIAMTHDQADFDAIASLFAASKIEGAQAVLPQKMNRNVNSFLNLYGTEFQFLENKYEANQKPGNARKKDATGLYETRCAHICTPKCPIS
jgi:nanoRNase/pAp phosphatase (c-di-AMP/oligoRNAs hydrolase)